MIILTHRGLEASKEKFFTESSYEAFANHLQRGFGVEFDINFTKDKRIIIFHDNDLERITGGKDKRLFQQMMFSEVKEIRIRGNRIADFDELMNLIIKNKSSFNSLHLKGKFQKKEYLDILLGFLFQYRNYLERLLIFDVKVETARYLKRKIPQLILAPSVAHPYDIERYNTCVGGTLIKIEEAIKNRSLFEWVWLDEWDRSARYGRTKKLYSVYNFNKLRKYGFKIALVSPELHKTSPGLLGGESHQDAKDYKTLFKRMEEIVALEPDAICTDWPDYIKHLIASN